MRRQAIGVELGGGGARAPQFLGKINTEIFILVAGTKLKTGIASPCREDLKKCRENYSREGVIKWHQSQGRTQGFLKEGARGLAKTHLPPKSCFSSDIGHFILEVREKK